MIFVVLMLSKQLSYYENACFDMCFCRHVGDLGNLEAQNGVVDTTIRDHLVTLFGEYTVIDRSFVVSIRSTVNRSILQ